MIKVHIYIYDLTIYDLRLKNLDGNKSKVNASVPSRNTNHVYCWIRPLCMTLYLVTGSLGTPGKEVHEAVYHMAVQPGDGAADAAEDDPFGDEQVDFVHIETVVSRCPQVSKRWAKVSATATGYSCDIHEGGNGWPIKPPLRRYVPATLQSNGCYMLHRRH